MQFRHFSFYFSLYLYHHYHLLHSISIPRTKAIHGFLKSLPPRPTIEELEAAISVIKTANAEEKQLLDEISIQICPQDVPPPLFSLLQKVRNTMVVFQSQEQKKEALHILHLDQTYQTFDELIHRASKCVSGDTQLDKEDDSKYPTRNHEKQSLISDESLLISKKIDKVESFKGLIKSSSTKATNFPSGLLNFLFFFKLRTHNRNGFCVLIFLNYIRFLVLNTIGSCSSLVVLKLDFNRLKGLPEVIGKLECLEILTLHYNRVWKLPTTMANLSRLRELDVGFNELEGIPESLCFATSLEKLIVGKNFADMTTLPRGIGNLVNLQVLDISDDQIRFLPESFGLLSNLKVFRADETPLEVPPGEITKLGAQVVVEYMANLVAKRNVKPEEV